MEQGPRLSHSHHHTPPGHKLRPTSPWSLLTKAGSTSYHCCHRGRVGGQAFRVLHFLCPGSLVSKGVVHCVPEDQARYAKRFECTVGMFIAGSVYGGSASRSQRMSGGHVPRTPRLDPAGCAASWFHHPFQPQLCSREEETESYLLGAGNVVCHLLVQTETCCLGERQQHPSLCAQDQRHERN